MAFVLQNVVPWGRTMEEYIEMFQLSKEDLSKKIAGFGDGPASFNSELTSQGGIITSFDPIYQLTKEQICQRIEETKDIVIKQMTENQENYNWDTIKSVKELEQIRMGAMKAFLLDYPKGKEEQRYHYHELPDRVPFEDQSFDLGLSSHFLLLYADLGLEFHIQSITEMLRLCKEIRIFPIINLDAKQTKLIEEVIEYFSKSCQCKVMKTTYEFQKGGNEILVITN